MRKLLVLVLGLLTSPIAAAEESSGESIDSCERVYEGTMTHYHELAKFLPKSFPLHDQLSTHQFLKLGAEACQGMGAVELFKKVVTIHSGKIGILLPFSRWSSPVQKAVMEQIKSYLRAQGIDPEKSLVWYDTAGQIQTLNKQLAQLVFNQHVAVVIGGLTMSEAPVLAKWADRLKLPTIVLSRKFDSMKSRFVFHLGPDLPQMAESLARYAQSRGLNRIAIVMPQSSRDGVFVNDFVARAEKLQLSVVGPLLYNPHDYGSIDSLFRKLFHLDDDRRAQEKLDLLEELKASAKEEGVAFDPRSLMLPPEIDVDAILIADHFKNARHLARSLAFYGVKKLPLLGIPKWRAPELIDPPEENLDGATLVDYIGSYRRLPYGIKAATILDENFVEGSVASLVDLQLVVNHAVSAAVQALRGAKTARFALPARLEKASIEDKDFFQADQLFRSNHEANWPSFLFSLTEGRLRPQTIAVSPKKATPPAR